MQIFDESPLDHNDCLTLRLRFFKASNYIARCSDLRCVRRERAVGDSNLLGVYQAFAIEAKIPPLLAGITEHFLVFEVQLYAINYGQFMGPRSIHAKV